MYHNFFIHSSVNEHLRCFHVLAIVNSAAMNIEIHMAFSILVSSGYMPMSGTAGSYGGFSVVAVIVCCFFVLSFPFIFISWRLINLQYCSGFCHTLT